MDIVFGQSGTRPYGVLSVNEIAVDTANNTSTVSVVLTLKREYPIYSSMTRTSTATVNGTTFTYTGTNGGSGDLVMINDSLVVPHNSDGTKTISCSATIDLQITWSGEWIGSISGSGDLTLTPITPQPTYATVKVSQNGGSFRDCPVWVSVNGGSFNQVQAGHIHVL